MIAFLRGEIAAVFEDRLILDVNGVGYEIFMPVLALKHAGRIGDEIQVYTRMNVREDAVQLFGFLTRDDLRMFTMLLSVNGIGPKAALGVLSGISADELRMAILTDDVKTISAAPGIGRKTAQKMILELKDKISSEDLIPEGFATNNNSEVEESSASSEAIQALMALGYSGSESMKAVKQAGITDDMSVEEILKLALKQIGV